MKKITTLFKIVYKEKGVKGVITTDVRPENSWVYTDKGVKATRKFDGTAVAFINGIMHKRYDVKPTKEAYKKHLEGTPWEVAEFKEVPVDAIACQEPDRITGHWPHWVRCDYSKKEDKYFFEGFISTLETLEDGTYELCGEKIGNNPEKLQGHMLIKHGSILCNLNSYVYDDIRDYLKAEDIEGIVFHHPDGRMCKIRKSDFGFKRDF